MHGFQAVSNLFTQMPVPVVSKTFAGEHNVLMPKKMPRRQQRNNNAKMERHCIVRAGVNLNNDDFASVSQRETSR
jgi:hypothetical protein